MTEKIAGAVVIYNPDKGVVSNIYTYLNQVQKLFLIDNSNHISDIIKSEFRLNNKVKYIPNLQNLGIAHALNIALDLADKELFNFLLTMDQDSYCEEMFVPQLLECMTSDASTSIVSPAHFFPIGKNKSINNQKCFDTLVVMTSGNLINVKILKSIGGFDEKLFIDYVDHEICLRLNKVGYKVKIQSECKIIHSLGNVREKQIFGKKIYPTNHHHIRYYYRTRNRLFVYKNYKKDFPEYVKNDKIDFLKSLIKIIFLEKNKTKKIFFIFKGFLDFKKNIFGEYKGKLITLLLLFCIV